MKAFIYVYTGKQSNVLTAFINVLQNLSFFFICLMIFIGEVFSSVFPRTFTFALSPAFVEFRLQGAQFPYHPEQKDQIQPY